MGSFKLIFTIFASVSAFEKVSGHGMMLDPPNRSSLWRYDPTAPINYNDNEVFCGGFGVTQKHSLQKKIIYRIVNYQIQWGVHQGKCGVCGDSYGDPIPRDNENTGKYGQGKVVAQYPTGSVVTVTVRLTANHKGWFNYR